MNFLYFMDSNPAKLKFAYMVIGSMEKRSQRAANKRRLVWATSNK